MNLSNLVGFARQIGQTENQPEEPESRPPDATDIPVEGAGPRIAILDLINRSPAPPWVPFPPGPTAEGVVIEEEIAAPPQPQPSEAIGKRPDVLAAYLPFHLYPDGRWGIYVLESGVAAVAAAIEPGTWPPSQETVDLAWNLLVDHERFHCLAECAVTRGETLGGWCLSRASGFWFHLVTTTGRGPWVGLDDPE